MAARQRERTAKSGGGAGRQCGVHCRLPQVSRSPHGCACHRPHEVTPCYFFTRPATVPCKLADQHYTLLVSLRSAQLDDSVNGNALDFAQ